MGVNDGCARKQMRKDYHFNIVLNQRRLSLIFDSKQVFVCESVKFDHRRKYSTLPGCVCCCCWSRPPPPIPELRALREQLAIHRHHRASVIVQPPAVAALLIRVEVDAAALVGRGTHELEPFLQWEARRKTAGGAGRDGSTRQADAWCERWGESANSRNSTNKKTTR